MKTTALCSFLLAMLLQLTKSKIMTAVESQRIIKNLLKDEQFMSSSIPAYPGKPVLIQLALTFIDMVPLELFYNHVFAELIFHQHWKDDRLKFNSSVQNATIILTGENVNSIWLPDLWIPHERGEPKSRFPSTESTVIITPDGYVNYTARFSIYVFCPMSYTYFPFDRQVCILPVESYAYNTQMVTLVPNESVKTVTLKEGFKVKDFILDEHDGISVEKSELDYGLTGTFDRITIRLRLRRHVYYYLMEYYLPLILVVSTSWISFWMDYRCTAARATLPVTTFLTLTSFAETLRAKDAGSLAYSAMLEIYINVCTFYVFAALMEFAIIGAVDHFLRKKSQENESRDSEKKSDDGGASTDNTSGQAIADEDVKLEIVDTSDNQSSADGIKKKKQSKRKESNNEEKSRRISLPEKVGRALQEKYINKKIRSCNLIDEYSKVIFPVSFIFFNIVYAAVCISVRLMD